MVSIRPLTPYEVNRCLEFLVALDLAGVHGVSGSFQPRHLLFGRFVGHRRDGIFDLRRDNFLHCWRVGFKVNLRFAGV